MDLNGNDVTDGNLIPDIDFNPIHCESLKSSDAPVFNSADCDLSDLLFGKSINMDPVVNVANGFDISDNFALSNGSLSGFSNSHESTDMFDPCGEKPALKHDSGFDIIPNTESLVAENGAADVLDIFGGSLSSMPENQVKDKMSNYLDTTSSDNSTGNGDPLCSNVLDGDVLASENADDPLSSNVFDGGVPASENADDPLSSNVLDCGVPASENDNDPLCSNALDGRVPAVESQEQLQNVPVTNENPSNQGDNLESPVSSPYVAENGFGEVTDASSNRGSEFNDTLFDKTAIFQEKPEDNSSLSQASEIFDAESTSPALNSEVTAVEETESNIADLIVNLSNEPDHVDSLSPSAENTLFQNEEVNFVGSHVIPDTPGLDAIITDDLALSTQSELLETTDIVTQPIQSNHIEKVTDDQDTEDSLCPNKTEKDAALPIVVDSHVPVNEFSDGNGPSVGDASQLPRLSQIDDALETQLSPELLFDVMPSLGPVKAPLSPLEQFEEDERAMLSPGTEAVTRPSHETKASASNKSAVKSAAGSMVKSSSKATSDTSRLATAKNRQRVPANNVSTNNAASVKLPAKPRPVSADRSSARGATLAKKTMASRVGSSDNVRNEKVGSSSTASTTSRRPVSADRLAATKTSTAITNSSKPKTMPLKPALIKSANSPTSTLPKAPVNKVSRTLSQPMMSKPPVNKPMMSKRPMTTSDLSKSVPSPAKPRSAISTRTSLPDKPTAPANNRSSLPSRPIVPTLRSKTGDPATKKRPLSGCFEKPQPPICAAQRPRSSSATKTVSSTGRSKTPDRASSSASSVTPRQSLQKVTSKVGSLANATHVAKGGDKKIGSEKLDFKNKASSRIGSFDNATHVAKGGEKKIGSEKLDFKNKASSRIGSFDNLKHKPAGGNVIILNEKLDFKAKAEAKVPFNENAAHNAGGGKVKIFNEPVKITASPKVGSLDNAGHRAGGGNLSTPTSPSIAGDLGVSDPNSYEDVIDSQNI